MKENLVSNVNYQLPYFDFGEGEKTFILLPGASMTSILEAREAVEALFANYSSKYHFYVFDIPNNLGSITSINQLANIIADALDVLNIKSADVYGASMGGMIAQKLAIGHSEIVSSLSLACSMSRNNDISKKVISTWLNIFEPEALAKEVNKHVYSKEFYASFSDAFNTMESSATSKGVERLHNLANLIKDFSSYDELDKIKCPVYVYAGGDDNTLGVNASIEIAEKLGCFIKIYDGYSHAVYDELPNFYDDVFNNLK